MRILPKSEFTVEWDAGSEGHAGVYAGHWLTWVSRHPEVGVRFACDAFVGNATVMKDTRCRCGCCDNVMSVW